MSWDAKGFEKPLILLEYDTTCETKEKNKYKVEEELEAFIQDKPSSEDFISRLHEKGKIKEACEYLASSINRRAGVWWAYLCVCELKKEQKEAADKHIDKETRRNMMKQPITEASAAAAAERSAAKGKNEAFKAKMTQLEEEVKNQSTQRGKDIAEKMAMPGSDKTIQGFYEQHEQMMAALSPEAKEQVALMKEQTRINFKEKYGKTIPEAVQDIVKANMTPPPGIADKSGYVKAQKAKLEAQVEGIKKIIKDKMSIFPLKIPGLPSRPSSKKADDALESALRWVLTPTQVNALLAADAGRNANRTPEGMLAFTAFWSGNNLSNNDKVLVVPPPGLSAKGIASTLFICAMAKNGVKKYDDRYKEYFNLGIQVAQGINTWDGQAFSDVAEDDGRRWEGHAGFGRDDETKDADDNLNF